MFLITTGLAYVDLNPIRANMAETPKASDFTSARKRIATIKKVKSQPVSLYPFVGNPREPIPNGLPFRLQDYLQLLDWTGRVLRDDKRGAINNAPPNILQRLNFSSSDWATLTKKFESKVSMLVGHPRKVQQHAPAFGYTQTPSIAAAQVLVS